MRCSCFLKIPESSNSRVLSKQNRKITLAAHLSLKIGALTHSDTGKWKRWQCLIPCLKLLHPFVGGLDDGKYSYANQQSYYKQFENVILTSWLKSYDSQVKDLSSKNDSNLHWAVTRQDAMPQALIHIDLTGALQRRPSPKSQMTELLLIRQKVRLKFIRFKWN